MDGCPHCVGQDEGLPLCQAGLNDVSVPMISRYARKAMTTWGSIEDYKYFLPRILELSATVDGEAELGTSVEDIVTKLVYARFEDWPLVERSAVLAFLNARWHDFILSPSSPDLLYYLRDVAPVVPSITDWLNEIADAPLPHSMLQLATLIDEAWPEAANTGRAWATNAFHYALSRDDEAARAVAAWLFSDSNFARLEAFAFERLHDDSILRRVSAALDAFTWVTPGRGTG